jgi:site-specific recombinase XerD
MIGQDEIIASFILVLKREGASIKTQKGYIADIKDFLNWISTNTTVSSTDHAINVTGGITKTIIEKYLHSQLEEQKSVATVNRRLSTLRMFFATIGIGSKNPTDGITNVDQQTITDPRFAEAISYWETHLATRGYDKTKTTERLTIIRDFLNWKSQHST